MATRNGLIAIPRKISARQTKCRSWLPNQKYLRISSAVAVFAGVAWKTMSSGHPTASSLCETKELTVCFAGCKHVCNNCKVCAEVKPCFGIPAGDPMIKALHPFDRISIDFKGPLPSASKNKYLLTVVDEFMQYPLLSSVQTLRLPPSSSAWVKYLQYLGCLDMFTAIV